MRATICQRLSVTITVAFLAVLSKSVMGQVGPDSIPFLPPEILRVDGSRLVTHQIEFEETTIFPGDSTDLDAFVYTSVESSHGWGERQLVINWKALTWNGTGFDRNLVSEEGLALRGRITPRGAPFGSLVESHYFPGVSNRTRVDPDGEVRRYATLTERQTGVHNEIIWPYLLSLMDLYEGRRFILPGYNPYQANPLFFQRFHVVNRPTSWGKRGGHATRVVLGASTSAGG